ncbi:MAG: aminotransferase class I/II-fold pyridoxal phosphate-dependent enzyme, partial [Spirochaetes bacterium]|nr:aminotransferase class I/II-fold pyridoxal phosphate-dependent enzyme [Spirochaetota bacterium]
LDMLERSTDLRDRLERSAARFRAQIAAAGFDTRPGISPIVPIMLYEEARAGEMARRLLEEGIYVIAFSYPVVPKGLARIRVQISAAHTDEDISRAVEAFAKVGQEMAIIATIRDSSRDDLAREAP